MPLLKQVQALCARLAPLGWHELLLRHGLDLQAANLAAELARPLPAINRLGVPGFGDFHADAVRAIEPGVPAMSLLYHALASPSVHPTPNGLPSPNPAAYPTLAELDIVENFIYAAQKRQFTAAELASMRVVVFAYQYRVAARTGHGLYADLTYARTGVARVGTVEAAYDGARRSFWPVPAGHPRQDLAAMGARYGAFLAVHKSLGPQEALVVGLDNDKDSRRRFWVPQHKLFAGPECLPGFTLKLSYGEFHRCEKLRRIHDPAVPGHVPLLPGFDASKPPFVRSSTNGADAIIKLQPCGSGSLLVLPIATGQLVRVATQPRSTTNRAEVVRFPVPKADNNRGNRYGVASLLIPSVDRGQYRLAPEYVNIRHEVQPADAATGKLTDLNALPDAAYRAKLNKGGYEAAHFLDDTADGCVGVKVAGLPTQQPPLAAYSLVTAPDFLPLVDQTTVFAWANSPAVGGEATQFASGSPSPLCRGRWPANPNILVPDGKSAAFDEGDDTLTAVLSRRQLGRATSQLRTPPTALDESVSYLPDAAANVFQPGWDVSLSHDAQTDSFFFTSFGLGSPFPEDAKLCAALNSFWPAAAPDASRTFGHTTFAPTSQPLLDREVGYHPRHRLVLAGVVPTEPGWDGEFGPFLEQQQGQLVVNYADLDRSDYVANTLAGLVHLDELSRITAEEMITRMEALRACIRHLPDVDGDPERQGNMVSNTRLFLVEAEAIPAWEAVGPRFDARLKGPGYRYVFVDMQGPETPDGTDVRRVFRAVRKRFECQLAARARQVALLVFDDDQVQQPAVLNP